MSAIGTLMKQPTYMRRLADVHAHINAVAFNNPVSAGWLFLIIDHNPRAQMPNLNPDEVDDMIERFKQTMQPLPRA